MVEHIRAILVVSPHSSFVAPADIAYFAVKRFIFVGVGQGIKRAAADTEVFYERKDCFAICSHTCRIY